MKYILLYIFSKLCTRKKLFKYFEMKNIKANCNLYFYTCIALQYTEMSMATGQKS